MSNNATLSEVYASIESELAYQDAMTASPDRADMIDLHLGDALLAMEYNLQKAREAWYPNAVPHAEAMIYVRKIAALAVQMGMKLGMPAR